MELAVKLVEMAVRRPRMWVLTGAGVSTESGIPDFRSPGTGLWSKVDPMEVFSVQGLARNPRQFYDIGYGMFDGILKAQPNSAHQVLGQLQQWGLIGPIVTQNIDDLHQKGGAYWVYEVHGHVRSATCMGCGRTNQKMREVLDRAASGELPRCPECDALLKPDVILFGDAMPADYMNAVLLKNAYKNHSLSILVVGSSLVVAPINYLPEDFDELAIINNDKTALDYRADLLWCERAGSALTQVQEYICQQTGSQNPERLPYGFLPGAVISNTLDRCLDANGQPKDLPPEQAAAIYAEALLWQETLEQYLSHRRSDGIAGLTARILLGIINPVVNAYKSNNSDLDYACQQAQAFMLRLIKDQVAVGETYMKTWKASHKDDVNRLVSRELILGTAVGFMGWFEWLCRTWRLESAGVETWQERLQNMGYADRTEVNRWRDEY